MRKPRTDVSAAISSVVPALVSDHETVLLPANGATNFGDELNMYLWRVFPDAFDEDKSIQFVGIGTLLNDFRRTASR